MSVRLTEEKLASIENVAELRRKLRETHEEDVEARKALQFAARSAAACGHASTSAGP